MKLYTYSEFCLCSSVSWVARKCTVLNFTKLQIEVGNNENIAALEVETSPRLYPSSVRPGAFIFDSALRSSVRHSSSSIIQEWQHPPTMLSPSAVRPLVRASPTSVELPKLRIPIEAGRQQQDPGLGYDNTHPGGYHIAPPVPVKTEASSGATMPSPHGPNTRSPSSPSSFFTQPEIAKLGLTPLLEAAEQMRPSTTETSPPIYGRSSPLKRELPLQQALPSIMHAMGGYPLETSAIPKRARIGSDVGLDVQASYSLLGHMPRQAMIYPSSTPQQEPLYNQQHVASYAPTTETQSPSTAGSISSGSRAYSGASVWETVLTTGKFPTDICLSENATTGSASPSTPFNTNKSNSEDAADTIGADSTGELKQGRWSDDEKEYANALIQAVQRGEVLLPPNVSLRKFVADNLQCKTMRVSKKFRSLGASPRGSPSREDEPVALRNEVFNPLSLKSIMNNESSSSSSDVLDVAETIANANLIRQSPTSNSTTTKKKPTQRVLKRSDYSQHGMVRSGRWSVEEENYAKAMIEAFKAGYLPLHGNVSLRKFLSEVLVCHPMRISKKFVGYVRKYHWYRIAAGKCDPEAKRQALYQLSHLERVFWTSLQQNSDWSAGLRRDD